MYRTNVISLYAALNELNKYDDNTPTFRFLKDGKLVEINAPDDDTIASMLKH